MVFKIRIKMRLDTLLWGLIGLFLELLRKLWPLLSKWNILLLKVFRGAKRKQPKNIPRLDSIEHVSNRCFRLLGCNPGPHTLQGTNCYLVGAGDTKVLIDTGEDSTAEEFLANLIGLLRATKTQRISHVFLTHGHHDHQGGVVKLLNALKKEGIRTSPVVMKRLMPGGGNYPPQGFNCLHIDDGQEFVIRGKDIHGKDCPVTTLKAFYTPGHTDDSICFLLKEDQALLSGDTVLGCGSAVFDSLSDLMTSLEKMRQLMLCTESSTNSEDKKDGASGGVPVQVPCTLHTIYPGHGPVCVNSGLAKIDEYLENRHQREAALLAALRGNGNATEPLSSMQLVDIVYREMNLSPILKMSANNSLKHHLSKLMEEGIVERSWPDLWSLSSSPNGG